MNAPGASRAGGSRTAGSELRGFVGTHLPTGAPGLPVQSMTHLVAVSHRMHALPRHGRAAEAIEEGLQALARAESSGAALAVPAIEMALVIAELADGDLASADARARRVVEVPQLHTAALIREALGRIALARADAREAAVQA